MEKNSIDEIADAMHLLKREVFRYRVSSVIGKFYGKGYEYSIRTSRFLLNDMLFTMNKNNVWKIESKRKNLVNGKLNYTHMLKEWNKIIIDNEEICFHSMAYGYNELDQQIIKIINSKKNKRINNSELKNILSKDFNVNLDNAEIYLNESRNFKAVKINDITYWTVNREINKDKNIYQNKTLKLTINDLKNQKDNFEISIKNDLKIKRKQTMKPSKKPFVRSFINSKEKLKNIDVEDSDSQLLTKKNHTYISDNKKSGFITDYEMDSDISFDFKSNSKSKRSLSIISLDDLEYNKFLDDLNYDKKRK